MTLSALEAISETQHHFTFWSFLGIFGNKHSHIISYHVLNVLLLYDLSRYLLDLTYCVISNPWKLTAFGYTIQKYWPYPQFNDEITFTDLNEDYFELEISFNYPLESHIASNIQFGQNKLRTAYFQSCPLLDIHILEQCYLIYRTPYDKLKSSCWHSLLNVIITGLWPEVINFCMAIWIAPLWSMPIY